MGTMSICNAIQHKVTVNVRRAVVSSFDDMPNVVEISNVAAVFFDDSDFIDLYRKFSAYGIKVGLLCPRHPDNCEKYMTDCCARNMWDCEVSHNQWDNGETYVTCVNTDECPIFTSDDTVSSLTDMENGEI